jgi:hypothetical protein
MGFLTLAYYPDFYQGTREELQRVQQLCVDWEFPSQAAIVTQRLFELRQSQLPATHRMLLKTIVVHHVYERVRLNRVHAVLIEEGFDDDSSDSEGEDQPFVEDD